MKIKRCEICHRKTEKLFKCKYCGKSICKECLTHEEGFGKVCVECFDKVPRQIEFELDI